MSYIINPPSDKKYQQAVIYNSTLFPLVLNIIDIYDNKKSIKAINNGEEIKIDAPIGSDILVNSRNYSGSFVLTTKTYDRYYLTINDKEKAPYYEKNIVQLKKNPKINKKISFTSSETKTPETETPSNNNKFILILIFLLFLILLIISVVVLIVFKMKKKPTHTKSEDFEDYQVFEPQNEIEEFEEPEEPPIFI